MIKVEVLKDCRIGKKDFKAGTEVFLTGDKVTKHERRGNVKRASATAKKSPVNRKAEVDATR